MPSASAVLAATLLWATPPAPEIYTLPPVSEDERRPGASGVHRAVRFAGPVDGRKPWRQAIRSPGAVALRVHFTQFSVGSGRVTLHDGRRYRARSAGPYTGRGPLGDGEFWSDVLDGDTVVVEYQPDKSGAPGVPFCVREISHIWDEMILGPVRVKLDRVRTVYVSPMAGGLDRWLVKEIKRTGRLRVLPSADGADAVWVEGLGRIELVDAASGRTLWSVQTPMRPSQTAARRLVEQLAADRSKRTETGR